MEKYKRADVVGIERENERDENYKSTRNPQIDKSKTRLNYHTVPYEKKYLSFIDERIKELAPKRKIKDDTVLITSFILGSDKEFFDRITAEQQKQFFADCTDFFFGGFRHLFRLESDRIQMLRRAAFLAAL